MNSNVSTRVTPPQTPTKSSNENESESNPNEMPKVLDKSNKCKNRVFALDIETQKMQFKCN